MSLALKIHHRNRIIANKKAIDPTFYKVDGRYNKGKIHCSCGMCSVKTKKNGHTISDIKKLNKLNELP